MLRLSVWLLAATLLCAVVPLQAQTKPASDQPVLKVGFVEFPPFKYVDENGEASGPWVDMTEQVAQQAGYRLEWVHLPIKRVYLYIQEGWIDLWPGVAGIPDLAGHVVESHVTPMRVVVYAFHEHGIAPPESLSALKGQKLVLINGFTYMGVLDALGLARNDVSLAPDHRSALQMLKLGRGKYLLNYDAPVEAVLPDFPELDLIGTPLFRARGAFIVSAQRSDATALVQELDSAFKLLVENDVLQPLQEPQFAADAKDARPDLF